MQVLTKNVYICAVALFLSVSVFSIFRLMPAGAQIPPLAEISREPELDAKIRVFFAALGKGNTPAAFEELLRQSPLNSAETGQIAELQKKTDELKSQFGEILTCEPIDVKRTGADVITLTYLLKYEQYPVQWTFQFYRKPPVAGAGSTSPWVLIEVQFGTKIGIF
ncbi:MAG: hypothetical protein LBH00_06575 [Planctomycetaceae bacterium]|jgi:hypothetical protein|nr:hypothetical protein [Planctomycetaceae bacterium]